MFPIIGKFHLKIGKAWPKEQAHVMIVVKNTTLHISCILVTRPKLRMPRRSVQLVGEVVEKILNAAVDAAVDAVADIPGLRRPGG